MLVEKIDIKNKYYEVECRVSKQSSKWLAQIRVKRKDTYEYIKGGFTVFDKDKNIVLEKAKSRIFTSLKSSLESSGTPAEWDTEVRKTLVLCKKIDFNLKKFGQHCINSLDDGKDDFWLEYNKFWKRFTLESNKIIQKIEMMDAQERIDLLTSPPEVFEDPSDSWSLEDLDSRIRAFDFFVNPSEKEKYAYEMQLKKLAARFEKLGMVQY